MPLETASYISQLDAANPPSSDPKSQGDNHLRMIKTVLQTQFPSLGAVPVNATAAQINAVVASSGLATTGTSTTSLTVGTGPKTLTTQPGRGFAIGLSVRITHDADIANYMVGQITAYDSVTGVLAVDVVEVGVGGTFGLWTVAVYVPLPLTPVAQETATLSADRTLTASSAGVQVVTPTGIGYSVILPDATPLSAGKQYIVRNDGATPVGLRSNGGALLGACDGGGTGSVTLTLTDHTTSAGKWAVTGDGYAPGLVTLHTELSSTYPAANMNIISNTTVDLDGNKSISFLPLSTGFAAVCIDNAARTIGTPAAVETLTMSSGRVISAFRVSSTSAIVFWMQTADACKAVVLTVSGTAITVGTVATPGVSWFVASGANFDDGIGPPRLVQLSATSYLVCGASSSTLRSTAISVSGTAVTIGTALDTAVTSVTNATISLHPLTSSTALVIYKEGSAAPFTNTARVISVSGTTCTAGSPVSCVPSGGASAAGRALLSPTLALIVDDDNSSGATVKATAVSISGTTCTAGSTQLIQSGLTSASITYGQSRLNPSVSPVSATSALITYNAVVSSITQTSAVAVSVSGTTITVGTVLVASINDNTNSGGIGYRGPVVGAGFLAIRNGTYSTSSGGITSAVAHRVSSTTVAQGLSLTLPQLGITAPNGLCVLPSGDHVLQPNVQEGNSGVLVVLRTDGDGVKVRGAIQAPQVRDRAPSSASGFAFRPLQNGFVRIAQTQNSSGSTNRLITISRIEVAA